MSAVAGFENKDCFHFFFFVFFLRQDCFHVFENRQKNIPRNKLGICCKNLMVSKNFEQDAKLTFIYLLKPRCRNLILLH